MTLRDLSKFTEAMEEVKDSLQNWGLDLKLNFETTDTELVVLLPDDSDYLLFDLLLLDNSRQVDNNVWLKVL